MTNPFDLAGGVTVVTGASRGIGFAIARHFLDAGAEVVIGGIDPEETRAAAAELAGRYGCQRVAGVHGDVSDPAVADRLVAEAVGRFGRLDALVCNAGIDIIKPATEYTRDEWDRVLEVNLRGAFLPAQSAAGHWIAKGVGGSVTMTSSVAARAGIRGLAAYGASKAGIEQLVRTLAIEWAAHGVRVNAVAPGYVENVMAGADIHSDPATDARIRELTPLGRRATVDEIAAPFVFLASAGASYVTGATLIVDGGYTAQ